MLCVSFTCRTLPFILQFCMTFNVVIGCSVNLNNVLQALGKYLLSGVGIYSVCQCQHTSNQVQGRNVETMNRNIMQLLVIKSLNNLCEYSEYKDFTFMNKN